MSAAQKAAIIGGGVIGGGWAARFLLNGWDVAVFDPDPEAQRKIGEVVANARRSLPALYDRALPPEGALTYHADMAEAVAGADWIQESVPERLDLKHRVHGVLTRLAGPDSVIGSSTSGFRPSELTAQGARVIVAHPFNPVYLLPLVELVGAPEHCARAAEGLRGIGMVPLTLRKEIDAHIADRLLEAVWRESLWLVQDGIATTEEIDEAIRMGFGLRWAQMGLFETYRIAGGEAGMKHFMEQFGPALEWPWTKLMDVPEFTPELVDLIAGQSDAQSGHLSIRDLERLRDDNLVGIMRALRATNSGAGAAVLAHEAALPDVAEPETAGAVQTVRRIVPHGWVDDYGGVSQVALASLADQATGAFVALIGGESGEGRFVTVESTFSILGGLIVGETVSVTTSVQVAEAATLRLTHSVVDGSGEPCAVLEQGLEHRECSTGLPLSLTETFLDRVRRYTV